MSDTGKVRVYTRIPEELRDEYERTLQLEGRSVSEDLRHHVRDVVRSGAEMSGLPDDGELREEYVLLDELASPNDRRVQVPVALSQLAMATNRPKENVKRAVLKPLQEQGFIEVWNGWITVLETGEVSSDAA